MTQKIRGLALHATLALALLTLLAAHPVRAEGEAVVEAHVPFSFMVENTTLPAGDYLVSQLETTPAREMEIASRDGSHRVLFLTESVNKKDPAPSASLVFNEYGAQKFLAQLWSAGSTVGEQLVQGRSETRHRKLGGKATERRVNAHPAAHHAS